MKKRVIVVGLDGACWEIINRIGLSRLPNLKKIIENGCSGKLTSTIPYLTPPAWTSAFTGVNPGKHGMFNFRKLDNGSLSLTTSEDVSYPMVWETIGKNDLKTIGVAVPMTYPPKEFNGVMVTGYGTPGTNSDFTYPKNVKQLLKQKIGEYRLSPLKNSSTEDYVVEVKELAKQNTEVTKFLMAKFPDWDLLLTVYSSPDWIQHYFWDDDKALYDVYKESDDFLGWLLDNVFDKNTYLVVMSDHGFEKKKYTRAFLIGKFLADRRYIKVKKSASKNLLSRLGVTTNLLKKLDILNLRYKFSTSAVKKTVPRTKDDKKDIDFEKSKVILLAEGAVCFNSFVSDEEKLKFKEELSSLTDPETGKKIVKRIIERDEIYWGSETKRAPDFLFKLENEYGSSKISYWFENKKDIIEKQNKEVANHALKGIHMFYGEGIKHMEKEMMIWDIAPMVLHMLGQPLYDDMDGVVHSDIFEDESELKKREIKKVLNPRTFSKKFIRKR